VSRISIRKLKRTLSERETKVLTELSYRNKSIFTPKDLEEFVDKPRYLLEQLIRKKWILKIRRGVYIIVPLEAGERGADSYTVHSFVTGSLLTKPYYIGYWSALNYYGFTEQIPSRVYIATTKPKNTRKILNAEFRFVTIPSYKMFDIDLVMIEGKPVNMSTPEKTFVDCLDHPEHAGGIEQVAESLYFSFNELKLKKLARLAIKIKNTAVIKRLGYISEILGLDECLQVISNVYISKDYSLLDPFSPKKGKVIERWNLTINTEIDTERWAG